MTVFDIHSAEAKLSQLLVRVEAGEPVVITCDGKPVARLVPYGRRHGVRRFGAMKGRFVVCDSFFEPLPEIELAAWER